MTQKFTLASNTTAGDRLLNVGRAAIQLSDGSLVMLVHDPSAAAPNKVTLQLVPAPAHTTPQTVATQSVDILAGVANFVLGGYNHSLDICRDASDNVYVVGVDNTTDPDNIGVQAFTKAAGATRWTPQTYVSRQHTATEDKTLAGCAALWCNTGGGTNGAGHLFVIGDDTNGNTYYWILDAGLILQGKGGQGSGSNFIKACAKNPAMLNSSRTGGLIGSNYDLSPDGFGATSGLLAIGTSSGSIVSVNSWGVSSGGALTVGGNLGGAPGAAVNNFLSSALSANTKVRVVRFAPDRFAVLYRSQGNPIQLTVRIFSSSVTLGGPVDTGIAGNFPAMGATLNWGVAAGAAADLKIWVYGWSSATPTTMLRLSITMTGAGVPSVGAAVADDTAVGTTPTTIRVVKEPVDIFHTDWQAYDSVSPYRLLGDFSGITTSPNAPTITAPVNGAITPLAVGGTLAWTDNFPLSTDTPGNHEIRRQISGGAYQYWTGSAWQTPETQTGHAAQSETFGAGQWTAGATYTVWVKTYGSVSAQWSPWSAGVTVVVANPAPATPTLTASFDQPTNLTTLTLHSTDASGPTGSIEFSDDAGVTWTFLRNASALVINPGTAAVLDYEAPHGTARQYRARSWTAYPTSYSPYATQSVTAVLSALWVKDPTDPTSGIQVLLKAGSYQSQIRQDFTEHLPSGRPFSLVVVGDLHGNACKGILLTQNLNDSKALHALIKRQRVLLLQSPEPRQDYIFIPDTTSTDLAVQETATSSHREHALAWVLQPRPS